MKTRPTQAQLDSVSSRQSKAATQAARQILGSVAVNGDQVSVGASLKTFIDYIAFSTLPVPENQGEASSLIQMYKGGAKDYESSLAGHERLHSKGAWAAARRFENDAAFQTELANFIESHDKPASDLLRIDTVFRSEILDPFRARDV